MGNTRRGTSTLFAKEGEVGASGACKAPFTKELSPQVTEDLLMYKEILRHAFGVPPPL